MIFQESQGQPRRLRSIESRLLGKEVRRVNSAGVDHVQQGSLIIFIALTRYKPCDPIRVGRNKSLQRSLILFIKNISVTFSLTSCSFKLHIIHF